MVVTAHFKDRNWKLQKRVLSFVRIPPHHRGINFADCLYECVKEWGIEKKIFPISVDNASANDTAIGLLKNMFSRASPVVARRKLFHVPCCAHIFNLLVQYGLSLIQKVIENVRDGVTYLN